MRFGVLASLCAPDQTAPQIIDHIDGGDAYDYLRGGVEEADDILIGGSGADTFCWRNDGDDTRQDAGAVHVGGPVIAAKGTPASQGTRKANGFDLQMLHQSHAPIAPFTL